MDATKIILARLAHRDLGYLVAKVAKEGHVSMTDMVSGKGSASRVARAQLWIRLIDDFGYGQSEVARLWGCTYLTVQTSVRKARTAPSFPRYEGK
jgi:uncharacterized protein GlcG (DUF336 family)